MEPKQANPVLTHFSQLSFRSRLSLISVVFWFMVSLIYDFNWKRGTYRAMMQVLVLLTIPVLMWLLRRPNQPAPHRVSRVLAVICIGLLCRHFVRFAHTFPNPALIDVPLTTLSAAATLLQGQNPYILPIDAAAGIDPRYEGFKYLPMMAAIYLPGSIWGQRGLLVTNLLLDLATVALVFRLSSRIGGRGAGWFAALLYVMLPLVPIEIFSKGTTDLAATVPLLIALLYLETRPSLAGFCVGLSVSTKLFPGALFIPCCLPPSQRGRYAAGIGLGLVPTLVFLALSPQALIYNTVLFSFHRSTDSTSWLHTMPPEVHLLSTVVVAFALIGVAVYVWYKHPTITDRCGIGVSCLLGVILIGPSNHRNYQLWWLPLFAVLLGTAAFRIPKRSYDPKSDQQNGS